MTGSTGAGDDGEGAAGTARGDGGPGAPGGRKSPPKLDGSFRASLEALRLIAVFASPVMPGASARLWAQLGIAEQLSAQYLPRAAQWGLLEPGTRTSKGEALFPRLDD